MNHDLKMTLHWFAKDRQWRLYTDDGMYYCATNLDEIKEAIRKSLLASARTTLVKFSIGEDQ
jgi:hypothetical protein